MNFSQREGVEPAVKARQLRSMDQPLRNSLWNMVRLFIVDPLGREWQYHRSESRQRPNDSILVPLWIHFFRWSLQTLPQEAPFAFDTVYQWFFDKEHTPWNRVYDFIEFLAQHKDT